MSVKPLKHPLHTAQGFTLIEVMVALVIFAVGLLGLAGLQSLGLTNNQTAYNRAVAMQQAYDIADRMRANIDGVTANAYNFGTNTPAPGTNCITASCTPAALAVFDHFEWNTANGKLLPSGRGSVNPRGGNVFQIRVFWDEDHTGTTNTSTCKSVTSPATYLPASELKCYQLEVEL